MLLQHPSISSTVTVGDDIIADRVSVVHAWVAQKLLECNEIKSFLVNRGAMAAGDRFAAAVCAAVQIRRCQSTASRPVRALTASFFRVRRALKQKTFPCINRLCAKRTWWPVVEQWSSDIWEKQKQR
jgi:hypothetical protein